MIQSAEHIIKAQAQLTATTVNAPLQMLGREATRRRGAKTFITETDRAREVLPRFFELLTPGKKLQSVVSQRIWSGGVLPAWKNIALMQSGV